MNGNHKRKAEVKIFPYTTDLEFSERFTPCFGITPVKGEEDDLYGVEIMVPPPNPGPLRQSIAASTSSHASQPSRGEKRKADFFMNDRAKKQDLGNALSSGRGSGTPSSAIGKIQGIPPRLMLIFTADNLAGTASNMPKSIVDLTKEAECDEASSVSNQSSSYAAKKKAAAERFLRLRSSMVSREYVDLLKESMLQNLIIVEALTEASKSVGKIAEISKDFEEFYFNKIASKLPKEERVAFEGMHMAVGNMIKNFDDSRPALKHVGLKEILDTDASEQVTQAWFEEAKYGAFLKNCCS